MKIVINVDSSLNEDSIIINCSEITDSIKQIQKIASQTNKEMELVFYKDEKEFFFSVNKVLFFETQANKIYAHTKDDCFEIKSKLYELENILPSIFIRISKSTIVNIDYIYSIERGLTSVHSIHFRKSLKQVYVSRSYYKNFKNLVDERKLFNHA